jgi:exonuclease III
MAGITYLSILTLNVNCLIFLIKRHQLANWIKKETFTIYCSQETYLMDRNGHCLRVKEYKKIDHAHSSQNQAGVEILTSRKIDFKLKLVRRDKEHHIILIKEAIH